MSASFVAASAPPATTISEIAPANPVNRLFIVILLGSLKMDGPRQGRRPAASNGSHGKNFSLKLNPTPFFDVEGAHIDIVSRRADHYGQLCALRPDIAQWLAIHEFALDLF